MSADLDLRSAHPPGSPLALPFTGRARELQAAGQAEQMLRELGSNYTVYHADLVERLRVLGGRPQASDFDSVEAFQDAFTVAQQIVRIEALLRAARQAVQAGVPVDYAYTGSVPLVDGDDRLVEER